MIMEAGGSREIVQVRVGGDRQVMVPVLSAICRVSLVGLYSSWSSCDGCEQGILTKNRIQKIPVLGKHSRVQNTTPLYDFLLPRCQTEQG